MSMLVNFLPFFLLATLLGFCILLFINRVHIISFFKNIKRRTWLILLLIIIIGFTLRFFVAVPIHNVYYDEIGYLDIAKNLAINGESCLCLYNIDETCLVCNYSLKSIGFSTLLAFFMKIFGISVNIAFYMVAFFGTMTVALIFFLVYSKIPPLF